MTRGAGATAGGAGSEGRRAAAGSRRGGAAQELVHVLAREHVGLANHRQVGVDGVQLPPHRERADERHAQDVDIGAAQRALAHEAAQHVVQPFAAARHALVEVDAADLGEPDAVGHQDAEELLLTRILEAVEGGDGELFEKRAGVGAGLVLEGREPLPLAVLVRRQQRVEQRVLARKVVVEGALAHADDGGHVAQAGAEVALLGEEVERGVEDGLAGALAVGILGASHSKLMVVHLIRSVNRLSVLRRRGPPPSCYGRASLVRPAPSGAWRV